MIGRAWRWLGGRLSTASPFWKWVGRGLACGALCLATAAPARAQSPNDPDELRKRIERLERQNEELLQALRGQQAILGAPVSGEGDAAQGSVGRSEVEKIVGDYIKTQETKKKQEDDRKKQEAEAQGHKVGSDLKFSARWNDGLFVETANKDFVMHLGGRLQWDNVWWTQDPLLRSPAQVGNLQDGTYFRRVRIQMDGSAYEVFEWNMEYALETAAQSAVGVDEFWVGITKIPFLGSIRLGHIKIPHGLEGDSVSSSKAMTFLERAAFADAFYPNFAPGVWAGNNVLDQRATWSAMFYRSETSLNAIDFGDGEYAAAARITGLPVYEYDGRCLVHLGASATWTSGERGGNELSGPRTVRFRARPEQRDASGDFGSVPTLPGNSVRWVDTGAIIADNSTVYGTEFLSIMGPFSVQAEWAWAFANDAVVNNRAVGSVGGHGGYVQLSYFLTGENRTYDRRHGRLGSIAVRPYTPFWVVRDADGGLDFGPGAWEVAARWSYLNLNDGPVQGGVLEGLALGLNWYLSPTFKLQFQYLHTARWHRQGASPPGNLAGDADSLGIRTQWFF